MKKLLLVVVAVLAGLPVHAAVTLKIATVTPENSDWMQQMRAGAEEIQQRTEGRVKIK